MYQISRTEIELLMNSLCLCFFVVSVVGVLVGLFVKDLIASFGRSVLVVLRGTSRYKELSYQRWLRVHEARQNRGEAFRMRAAKRNFCSTAPD